MPGSDRDGDEVGRVLEDIPDVDACQQCPCACDVEDLLADERGEVERRDVAKLLATVGGLTAVGSLAAPLAGLSQVFEREYEGPIYSDDVALVDDEGEPVTENFLEYGDFATVFPESNPGLEDAPTLLVRFEEGEYGDGTDTDWVASGYAAYSKVCTHAGCMVSDFEGTTLVCPCHAGKFDPLSGASVVGGPPPRPLPQLPLRLADDGTLVAGGDFEGPIGVGGE
ncbi:Rieske (2Fe-2S) protein [Halomicrobium urmianum]|uniref:Rieske (2Fe-2S) protein n=1 Tax=Halomicrobium urmianum TaxID=1586233 RepID=UPI001CD98730|nr:Rieske 2Fe-2S domain-containing protein [Halomicrobium urmianum]